jgi:hypothetical protein
MPVVEFITTFPVTVNVRLVLAEPFILNVPFTVKLAIEFAGETSSVTVCAADIMTASPVKVSPG